MNGRISNRYRAWVAVGLGLMVSGCTAVGYMVGHDLGDPRWGRPIPVDEASSTTHGAPMQVELHDGGFVRGIYLGTTALDSSATAPARRALRLGVGDRLLLDRLFETGKPIQALKREQVPDTLVFAFEGIQGLRVHGTSHKAGTAGAAVGLTVDLAILGAIGTVGLLVWLLSRGN